MLLATHVRVAAAQSLFSSSDNVERVQSSVVFDTLWVFGGPSDTLLASPRLLRHDGAMGVVFFDAQNGAVYRVGADGDLLWSWGSPGEGPGELSNVRALDVGSDGSVVLVDSGNRRMVRLSGDGLLLEEVPVSVESFVASVAALSGGHLAVHAVDPLLALWNEDDMVEVALPSGLGETSMLRHQGRVARWGDEGWVFGFGVGNGWMKFRGVELLGVFPYVDHVDFPEVSRVQQGGRVRFGMTTPPTPAGRALSVVGDTLHVLFGTGWLLDRFDVRSGSYLASDLLPHYADEAVLGRGRTFTLTNHRAVLPTIVALARR